MRTHDVTASMDPDTRDAFRRLGRPTERLARECLMLQGAPSDHMLLVEHGLTAVDVAGADGVPTFVAFRGTGDLLGEFGLLDGGLRSATVTTLTEVQLRVFPARAVHAFLASHPVAAVAVTAAAVRKNRDALARRIRYGTGEPAERIARVVLDHARDFGRAVDGGILIDVPLSQERIADLVHGRPRSVGGYLTRWSGEGLLTTGYRGRRRLQVLDRRGLAALAA